MRKMSKKLEKQNKTAAVFNDFVLESNEMFIHCCRIPDVMVRVIKAREILKKYKIKPPAWMFGLAEKGETFDSPAPLHLMSFLVSMGLYDRLVRLIGTPDFLIGSSRALMVSAKLNTFEKNTVKIFCGMKHDSNCLSVYKKKQSKMVRFSLLHFSEQVKKDTFQIVVKNYGIEHCVLICPSSYNNIKENSKTAPWTVEGLIEMDPQLAWFWPILKRKQLAKSGPTLPNPFSLNTSFH